MTHVALRCTSTGVILYINGEALCYEPYAYPDAAWDSNSKKNIGGEILGNGDYTRAFNGQIADFRLYVTDIGEQGIKDLYSTSAYLLSTGELYAMEFNEVDYCAVGDNYRVYAQEFDETTFDGAAYLTEDGCWHIKEIIEI